MFKKLFSSSKSSCCDVKITEVKENDSAAAAEAQESCCAPKGEEAAPKSCCK